ncbi:MAG: ABC transporter substrate-binding protein [Nitrospirae bacterium]|nr:ABC transporter substrate-binding protein [Nitrospirota bacterium]MBI3593523.1 ABC transporter substrate-binding protein [Nitrospirota bacterium]
MKARLPERIICLSGETVDVLYQLGEENRIVGVSCFTDRPPRARKEKPVVSSFTSADIKNIIQLNPDLVLGFSDLQGDLFRELVKSGLQVHLFNQRTIQGILDMILMLGGMVGAQAGARRLMSRIIGKIEKIRKKSALLTRNPVVYFEEWDEPLICGIGWVSELITVAGGTDCFAELATRSIAAERILRDSSEIMQQMPDIIIGSWCGKPFNISDVRNRDGWNIIPAIRNGNIFEIRASDILQPGPAALTIGLEQLSTIILNWEAKRKHGFNPKLK